jgi:serine phosphatase RsbU (regulator of sigma subunit)
MSAGGSEVTECGRLSGQAFEAAQALEHARLFDAERARGLAVQRDLLPQALPSPPAVTVAARYLPAGPGTNVGGDWYDFLPLSADRVALVVGDVMGHGLPQAVIMGQLRTAVQTFSELGLPPDEILGQLNELVTGLPDDCLFATCLYVIYDPIVGTCIIARVGHPPPAVVQPDGTYVLLMRPLIHPSVWPGCLLRALSCRFPTKA